jgi:hypothetical protein
VQSQPLFQRLAHFSPYFCFASGLVSFASGSYERVGGGLHFEENRTTPEKSA